MILILSSYFYCSAYRLFIIILFYFACIIIGTFSVCLFITLIYKLHFLLLVLSYHALYVLFCNAFLGSRYFSASGIAVACDRSCMCVLVESLLPVIGHVFVC